MVRQDGVYALTRRRGKSGTVRRLINTSAIPTSGVRSDNTDDVKVRFMFKGSTEYSRLYRAERTQQRIGDTVFVIYLPDVSKYFTELTTEDQIIYQGKTYEVKSSDIEDTGLVVTATEYA